MPRKSKLMQSVERKYHKRLEDLLPEMIEKKGLEKTAGELGVAKATVQFWFLALGIPLTRLPRP